MTFPEVQAQKLDKDTFVTLVQASRPVRPRARGEDGVVTLGTTGR